MAGSKKLSERIRETALLSGAEFVGITTADPFEGYAEEVDERASRAPREEEGSWPYYFWKPEFEKLRSFQDPRNRLPTAKSIVVVGAGYFDAQPVDLSQPGRPCGVLGRLYFYGCSPVIAASKAVKEFVEREGYQARIYGIPERWAAVRAGLGLIGKNSFFITPEFGSWGSLRTILTDVELDYDDAPSSRGAPCGKCTKCMDACPTGVIYAPYKVDYFECIPFFQYRLAAPIPLPIREKMGKLYRGCDACQEACPLNKKAKVSLAKNKFIVPGAMERSPYLPPLLNINEAEWQEKLPPLLGWFDPDGRLLHQRNAAVALGNSKDPSAIPALLEAAQHNGQPLVRGHAAWVLGRIGAGDVSRYLKRMLNSEQDIMVRLEIRNALAMLGERDMKLWFHGLPYKD